MFMAYWNNFNKVFLHGYIWFGFCGAAAAMGAARYGLQTSPHTVSRAHDLACWVSSTVGMANLAAQFYIHHYDYVSV